MDIQEWKYIKEGNRFRWEAYNQDGIMVGTSSQTFASKAGAHYNAKLLGESGSYSRNLEWSFTEDNGWHWKTWNRINKETVGKSHEAFATQNDAFENAGLFGYDFKKTGITTGAAAGGVNLGAPWWVKFLVWLLIIGLLLMLLALLLLPWLRNSDINLPDWLKSSSSQVDNPLDSSRLDTFQEGLELTGLDGLIDDGKEYTFFAPTDAAFDALGEETKDSLFEEENKDQLKEILQYHTYEGEIDKDSITDGATALAKNNQLAKFAVRGNEFDIENAKGIKFSNLKEYKNISVYEVDTIITKQGAMADASSDAEVVEDTVETPEPVETTQPVTVTEPVTPDTTDNSAVTSTDANATNEVNTGRPIVAAMVADGRFSSMIQAIEAAGLADELNTNEDITIFAPTDEAIAKIKPQFDELLKPENKDALRTLLLSHVADGQHPIGSFVAGDSVTTKSGVVLDLELNMGRALVTGDQVVNVPDAFEDDFFIGNALIHTLDAVIILK